MTCLLLINFHTWLLKILQLFISLIRIMSHKEGIKFSMFCFTALIGHKKWIELGSTLDKPPKCSNHGQFHHTMKILFLQQLHFIEQCNLAVHMLWSLRHLTRFNNTILCFQTRYIYLCFKRHNCAQNNMVYCVWWNKTPWLVNAATTPYD